MRRQSIKIHDGLLHQRAQSRRHRPAIAEKETVDQLLQPAFRFLVRHIMDCMNTFFDPSQLCCRNGILDHIQMGMYRVGLLFPHDLYQFGYHGEIQSQLLVQVADPDARRLHPLGNRCMLIIKAHDTHLMSQLCKGVGQVFTHGFRTAKAEIRDDLQNFHSISFYR